MHRSAFFSCLLLSLPLLAAGCLDATDASTSTPPAPPDVAPEKLRDRIDAVLDYTVSQRLMSSSDQAAWQIVHGLEAFGRDLKINADGKEVGALKYLLAGNPLKGWNMRPADHGVLALLEAGSKTGQGHPDQWLGYLSQCGDVKLDDPLVVGGHTYHVRDLLTQAQWDLFEGEEASWTLMAAVAYLPLDATWTSKDGTKWTVEKLVKMEAEQPFASGGCFGSHRLYALAIAVRRYMNETKTEPQQLTGGWKLAQGRIAEAKQIAREFQQPDGSLSSGLFSRPSNSPDLGGKVYAGGHTLEFLVVSMSPEELEADWMTEAVERLVEQMEELKGLNPDCGALYHASHGLKLYRDARFGADKEE